MPKARKHPLRPARGPSVPTLSGRHSGVLLHPTSLAGPPYNGDLGQSALAFVDYLQECGASWWQMLPVNPTGDANSPYSTTSSFACEPLLISLDDLVTRGLLKPQEIHARQSRSKKDRVDYTAARKFRSQRLRLAFTRAQADGDFFKDATYKKFIKRSALWLDGYSLFCALAAHFGTKDWTTWPSSLRRYEAKALAEARIQHADLIAMTCFEQFLLDAQWQRLKAYAHRRGIGLVGDIPIFVGHQSADVWANQEFFCLAPSGKPRVVAGCPPDRFNPKGQLWGNALYDWAALQKHHFHWWVGRFQRMQELFDLVRVDHFIGFHRYWEIPCQAKTAQRGTWRQVPGREFFRAVTRKLGNLPIIAEDLGLVTPEVTALREEFGFPGMRIIQFGFSDGADAPHHRPHFYTRDSVAYTGTHDMETARGYLERIRKEAKRHKGKDSEYQRARAYLATDEADVHWAMIRAALASVSNTAIVQMQDLLGLGTEDRMNTPGTVDHNWEWRLTPEKLNRDTAAKFLRLNQLCDRGGFGSI